MFATKFELIYIFKFRLDIVALEMVHYHLRYSFEWRIADQFGFTISFAQRKKTNR